MPHISKQSGRIWMCFNQQEGSGLTTPVVGHERSVLSTKVLPPSPPLPSKVLVHWQHQAQKKMFNTQIYFSIIIYSQCRKQTCLLPVTWLHLKLSALFAMSCSWSIFSYFTWWSVRNSKLPDRPNEDPKSLCRLGSGGECITKLGEKHWFKQIPTFCEWIPKRSLLGVGCPENASASMSHAMWVLAVMLCPTGL